MAKKNYFDEAGFTLIEVLIALVIFAVGILGVALMQMTAIRGNSTANQVSEATVFATDQLERLLSWKYDDDKLNPANNSIDYVWDGENRTADGKRVHESGHYTAYWEVEADSPAVNSKTIDLRVVWEVRGQQKQVRLSAIKPR
ncbi:MAG: prepilin-type N-terminal cleavage/methylation domain-containing protein [Desulfuromonadaceae bacterium]|nr:prepilin-type N-terminal cleavage/methylation domain-containing protein [Desulfuromonadaceae bacterium]